MAKTIQRGANSEVPQTTLTIRAVHKGPDTDLSALLLNAAGKVRSDADFVFYGQPKSVEGSVQYVNKTPKDGGYEHELKVALASVPADVERIAITLTIDPTTPATFAKVQGLQVTVTGESGEPVQMSPEGTVENAFIVAELYRRNGVWKVRHVAQGFTDGLAGIARAFGVSLADDGTSSSSASSSTATPTPPAAKISLSKVDKVTKEMEQSGSRLLSLQKSAALQLKKHKLDNVVARVMMVLDASGSTSHMWPNTMQPVLDRLAVVAINMDDNGELEFWGYAGGMYKYDNVTLKNLDTYIATIMKKKVGSGWGGGSGILPGLGYDNNEPPVMRDVLKTARETPNVPTLCIFVTDGGITRGREIEQVLIEASKYNVFWQFVGLGGSSYGILEEFDTMPGRTVDNASFFAIDDYKSVTDAELYDRLVKEFPAWLAAARAKNILPAA